jgi:Zn-dependent protease
MDWWLSGLFQTGGIVLAGSWIIWVIGSIVLHELAHGWMAIRCGDRTPIESGHMTWNPLVHMGQMSLIMFALIGIAWGAMPVDPSRFRGRYDDAKVSIAGPLMNLALAVGSVVGAAVWAVYLSAFFPDHVQDNVRVFLSVGAALNIALMLFNLVPVPPLDGSRIVADFVPSYRRLINTEHGAVVALILSILLFMKGGSVIFGAAFDASRMAIAAVSLAIGGGATP